MIKMGIMEHEGSKFDRCETIDNLPENEWNSDVLEDLLLGLWDHGWQVSVTAEQKLLDLACTPDIKSFELHPSDLATRYIKPGTYE